MGIKTGSSDMVSRNLAEILVGSWRELPPPLEIATERVVAALPLLLESGGGALAWKRICRSGVRVPDGIAEVLRNTYRESAIQAGQHEFQLCMIVEAVRSSGVEPILIKGWASSRLYSDSGLRPSGDIDLCVSPEQQEATWKVCEKAEHNSYVVDLDHDEITKFGDQSFGQLYDRSELVQLDGTEVRVLGAEDHLRVLCMHFLKHGGWRPIWLCDIASALEARPANFNWAICLGKNRRRADWVLCALALANQLLGAELGDAPIGNSANRIPEWLTFSVLKQWGRPHPAHSHFEYQFKKSLEHPREFLRYLATRWPNPIVASVDANADFDQRSRLPLQTLHFLKSGANLFPRLLRMRWTE
ncbi:MAG: nucleotidyltransferase family protein [Acidobacteriota bacterium]|nr:nucleotidyltransferase family protein [Acidobacteriota bacterium]